VTRAVRLLLVPPLLAVGVVTGVSSVALHDRSWAWFALTVAAPVVTVLALSAGWLRVAFATGWVLVAALAASGRPEGDYAVAAGGRGYAFLGVTLVLVVLALATVPVRPRRTADESGTPGDRT
jgi:hypothetical protein